MIAFLHVVLLSFLYLQACQGERSSVMLMGAPDIESILMGLERLGELTASQRIRLLRFLPSNMHHVDLEQAAKEEGSEVSVMQLSSLEENRVRSFLKDQVQRNSMSDETEYYILNALNLVEFETVLAPVESTYSKNYVSSQDFGIVQFLGNWNQESGGGSNIYNGIWGVAIGNREYALQTNHRGLHIIDVTDPTSPFRVQFIAMSGGTSEFDRNQWQSCQVSRLCTSSQLFPVFHPRIISLRQHLA